MNSVPVNEFPESTLIEYLSDELVKANAELQQFAWVVSHDLKEPLRVVSNYVALLQRSCKDQLSPEAQQYIKFLIDSTARMSSLLAGLHVYSGVDRLSHSAADVNCNKVFSVVLSNLDAVIRENEVSVEFGELPTVKGNGVQLGQVFQNLVANSVKFRRDACPKITVTATKEEDFWRFEVKDNGIGIEPRYLNKVFGLFQRLHADEKYRGAGVGLAICKKIVDKHGGKIWAESINQDGSSFFFTIPIRA